MIRIKRGATPTKPKDLQNTYTFSGWSPSLGPITGNTTYTAQFTATAREYEVIVEAVAHPTTGAKCDVSGGGKYKYGDIVTLVATNIPEHYIFGVWGSRNSEWVDNNASVTITLDDNFINSDTTDLVFEAYITLTPYVINFLSSPKDSGVVLKNGVDTPPETGTYGETITVTATPNEGYRFVKWDDGVTTASRTITVTGNATYTAYFEIDKINNIFVNEVKPKAIYFDKSNIVFVVDGTIPSLSGSIWDTVDGFHIKVQNTIPSGMTEAKEIYVDLKKYFG